MTQPNRHDKRREDQLAFRSLWLDGRLSYHPEAETIPRMRPEEFADHLCGMAVRGFDAEHPIVLVADGGDVLILDGRHRSEAATILRAAGTPERLAADLAKDKRSIPREFYEAFAELDEDGNVVRWKSADFTGDRWLPVFVLRDFEDEVAMRDYVYDHNIRRRHLTQSQLAALALPKYRKLVAAQAKPKAAAPSEAAGELFGSEASTPPPTEEPRDSGRAREVVAAAFSVSPATVSRMAYIAEHAPTVLGDEKASAMVRQIEQGELEVGRAYKQVHGMVKERAREAARQAAIEKAEAREQQATEAPELPGVTSSAWWSDGGVELHNDDFFSVADELPSRSIALIFCDPSYNLGDTGTTNSGGERVPVKKGDWDVFASWAEFVRHVHRWLDACDRLLATDGALWVTGNRDVVAAVVDRVNGGAFDLQIVNDIPWTKPNPPPRLSTNGYKDDHEWILVLRRRTVKAADWRWSYAAEKERCGGKQPRATWSYGSAPASERRFGSHPCQKPRALVRRILESCRIGPGDRVLEPFGGLGPATLEAAAHGAGAVYCELEGLHCEAVKAALLADRTAGREHVTSGKVDEQTRAEAELEAVPVFVLERRHGDDCDPTSYEWSGEETIVRPASAQDLAETVIAELGLEHEEIAFDVLDAGGGQVVVTVIDRRVERSLSRGGNHPERPEERARLEALNEAACELVAELGADWPRSPGEPVPADCDGAELAEGVRVEVVDTFRRPEGRAGTVESVGEAPYANGKSWPITIAVDGQEALVHLGAHQVRVLTAEREAQLQAAAGEAEPVALDEVEGPPPNYTIEPASDGQKVAVFWQGERAAWTSEACDNELDAIDRAREHAASLVEIDRVLRDDLAGVELTARQREALAALADGALAYHSGRWYRATWRPSKRAKPRTVAEHGPNPDEDGFAPRTTGELEAAKLAQRSGDDLVITDRGRAVLARPWAPKRRRKAAAVAALLFALVSTGCTAAQRQTALMTIGAAGCGGGQAAEAAGEQWGTLAAAIGCWLADWAGERLERIREAEQKLAGEQSADAAAELARIDAIETSAAELRARQAALLDHPCEQHLREAKRALERCEALRRGAAI